MGCENSKIVGFICKGYDDSTKFRLPGGNHGTCEELAGQLLERGNGSEAMKSEMARAIVVNDEQDCEHAVNLSGGEPWLDMSKFCNPITIKACSGTVPQNSRPPYLASGYFSCAKDYMRNNLTYINNMRSLEIGVKYLLPFPGSNSNLFEYSIVGTALEVLNGRDYNKNSLRFNAGLSWLSDMAPPKLSDDTRCNNCSNDLNGVEVRGTFGMTYQRSLIGSEGKGLMFETSAMLLLKPENLSILGGMMKAGLKFAFWVFAVSAGGALILLPGQDFFAGFGPYLEAGVVHRR